MSERERIFDELEALFSRLQSGLPRTPGNPCGSCRECCTTSSLTRHDVTRLELDYIASRVGPERVEEFRRFAARQGKDVCPYYESGCTIYPHRPYSCRVYGHYRSVGTVLPEVCVFRGRERVAAPPEHLAFQELAQEYWLYAFEREGAKPASGAESSLEELGGRPPTAYYRYCRALVHEQGGRNVEALRELELALEEAPRSHLLLFRLGCNLFSLGRRREALEAFKATVSLHHGQATAWGFLGLTALLLAERDLARRALGHAAALDPGNSTWSERLLEVDGEGT